MLAFIDESGDPGLKLNKGSTKFFTLSMVYFEDESEAINCDNRIEKLKFELKVNNKNREIKFSSLKREQRLFFLKKVLQFNFFYISLIVNKEEFLKSGFEITESNFYKYCASLLFEVAKPSLYKSYIIIDGESSTKFKQELSKIFKSRDFQLVKNLKPQESHKNNLLQLADMIVGSTAKTVSDSTDKDIYRNIIKIKEIQLKIFPPKDII